MDWQRTCGWVGDVVSRVWVVVGRGRSIYTEREREREREGWVR
jgi:hypothetical protein